MYSVVHKFVELKKKVWMFVYTPSVYCFRCVSNANKSKAPSLLMMEALVMDTPMPLHIEFVSACDNLKFIKCAHTHGAGEETEQSDKKKRHNLKPGCILNLFRAVPCLYICSFDFIPSSICWSRFVIL